MRSFTRRLLRAARIWDYLLGRQAGQCPPVRPARLGLEQCEAREQPGSMLDGLLAVAFGGMLADPLVAMTGVVRRAGYDGPADRRPA